MTRKDKSASKWTLKKFNDIKLKYNDTCVTLAYFSEKFLNHLRNTSDDFETVHTTLDKKKLDINSYMETYWNFTIDIKERRTNRIEKALEKLNCASDEDEDLIRWRTNLKEFLTGLCMVLQRPGGFSECVFTQLFMAFSRIFSLYPELGEMYMRGCYINEKKVNGKPDVRFETFPTLEDSTSSDSDDSHSTETTWEPKLVLVTEVKKKERNFVRQWRPRSLRKEQLSAHVKIQHGLELLIEINTSLFEPDVFGCICIDTYIIITHLRVDQDNLKALRKTGSLNRYETIQYSRPYDYLDKTDRREIVHILLFIGYMQANSET